jgi:hypothetical protein
MSNHAPRASRSYPAGACLVFLGVRGLQPWAMGLCLEGPTQSCPMDAYSSGRGQTEPAPSGAHGFQPRTPRTCACGCLPLVFRLESPLSPRPMQRELPSLARTGVLNSRNHTFRKRADRRQAAVSYGFLTYWRRRTALQE